MFFGLLMGQHIISGDAVANNAPEKAQLLASFGDVHWSYCPGVKGQTLFEINTRGYLIIGLVYSPQKSLTPFRSQECKPLAGMLL